MRHPFWGRQMLAAIPCLLWQALLVPAAQAQITMDAPAKISLTADGKSETSFKVTTRNKNNALAGVRVTTILTPPDTATVNVSPDRTNTSGETTVTVRAGMKSVPDAKITLTADASAATPPVLGPVTRSVSLELKTPGTGAGEATGGGGMTAKQEAFTLKQTPLTIFGIQGEMQQITLNLHANKALRGLHQLHYDLPRVDAGGTRLPSSAVTLGLPLTPVQEQEDRTVTTTIDLKKAGCGEYSGELLIALADNPPQSVPLNIKVKANWKLPLLTLASGYLVGLAFSGYRAQGRRRDLLRVRVGVVQSQVRVDSDLNTPKAQPFRHKLDAEAELANEYARSGNWTEAERAAMEMEALWHKWSGARADWMAQLRHGKAVFDQAQAISGESLFKQGVQSALTAALENAPAADSPLALQPAWLEGAAQIARWNLLMRQMVDLDGQVSNLTDPALQSSWREQAQRLHGRTELLKAEDGPGFDTLLADIGKTIDDLGKALGAPAVAHPALAAARAALPAVPAVMMPLIRRRSGGVKAQRNLLIYTVGGYALAFVFLVWVAFIELYVNKAVFGANVWSDYLTLLLAGFGAEASRTSVLGAVRAWDIPGVAEPVPAAAHS